MTPNMQYWVSDLESAHDPSARIVFSIPDRPWCRVGDLERIDEERLWDILCTIRQVLTRPDDGLAAWFLEVSDRSSDRTGRYGCYFIPMKRFGSEVYDVVTPFGDERSHGITSDFIIDIPKDTIQHVTRGGRRSSSISALLQETRIGQKILGNFDPAGPLLHPCNESSISEVYPKNKPYWKLSIPVEPRDRAFTYRIIRDFDFQWRHILRAPYNSVTRRVLARALLNLATLNFQVVEDFRFNVDGHETVDIDDQPIWQPLKTKRVRVGGVYVLVCESLQKGFLMAEKHARERTVDTGQDKDDVQPKPNYMLLSVRHIALCRVTDSGGLECTLPEPLWNGDCDSRPPSDLALDYLHWATAAARRTIQTPIRGLPMELQNMVLDQLWDAKIVCAHAGSMLRIGSPFRWNLEGLVLALHKSRWMPEFFADKSQQIRFGDFSIGVSYIKEKGERDTRSSASKDL